MIEELKTYHNTKVNDMKLEIQKLNSLIENLKSETMERLADERRDHQSVILITKLLILLNTLGNLYI